MVVVVMAEMCVCLLLLLVVVAIIIPCNVITELFMLHVQVQCLCIHLYSPFRHGPLLYLAFSPLELLWSLPYSLLCTVHIHVIPCIVNSVFVFLCTCRSFPYSA